MAVPTLTPKSTKSAIILPVTGNANSVSDALPFGVYTSAAFNNGASAQVAYTYKRLGGDVLDIELTENNVYAHYEEAVLEYSYLVNVHQAKNILGDSLGASTGSFDQKGGRTDVSGNIELKYPEFTFKSAFRVTDAYSTEAVVGGNTPVYSASFGTIDDQQDYDLQSLISLTSSQDPSSPFFGKVGSNRVFIKQVYYVSPTQMWRFYGYYGGLNVVGDMHNYGQYADDSSFQVIPPWQNKLQAIQYEDHLYTRTSHYSYEIVDNKLRLYPIPSGVSPDRFWVRFTIDSDPWDDRGGDRQLGINNMNTLPFENIPYENINSIGKQWIRRFALALSKETLGQIRGKFSGNVPIPGDNISLNASDLLSQAKEEQEKLREELKTVLDEMTYSKLVEEDAAMAENTAKVVERVPMKIFVG